jgi:hypothetical protein
MQYPHEVYSLALSLDKRILAIMSAHNATPPQFCHAQLTFEGGTVVSDLYFCVAYLEKKYVVAVPCSFRLGTAVLDMHVADGSIDFRCTAALLAKCLHEGGSLEKASLQILTVCEHLEPELASLSLLAIKIWEHHVCAPVTLFDRARAAEVDEAFHPAKKVKARKTADNEASPLDDGSPSNREGRVETAWSCAEKCSLGDFDSIKTF